LEKGVIVLFLLMGTLIVSDGWARAEEETEMLMELTEEGPAHVTLEIINPNNIEELKSIITEPAIKGVYLESFTSVFGEVQDFEISASSSSIVMEFDTTLAQEEAGVWVVDRTDFDGRLNPITELKVVLPEGYNLKEADPQPDEIREGYLLWRDADYIPGMAYERGSSPIRQLVTGLLIITLLIVAIMFKNRRKSP